MRRAAAILGLVAIAATAWHAPIAPPSFDEVRRATLPSEARLLDRQGRLLQEQRVDAHRRRLAWVPLDAISPAVRATVVAAEDRRFARHPGVDPLALAGALRDRALRGPRRGASTITMQVAGMIDPALRRRHGIRTLAQKARQMRLALGLERRWTKAEILEAYLNLVPVRGEVEGIGAAARVLFGKGPDALDAIDAAVFAALLQAPSAPEAVVVRRARGLLTHEDAGALERIVGDALAAVGLAAPPVALAPHVARRLLADGRRAAPSTLDQDLQRLARDALRRQLAALRSQHARDGAVLVVDNASGDVLAYVGSSGDLSRARFVDGVTARRQAGSTLKPFVYAEAIERRLLTAAALLDDAPLEVPTPDGLYRPPNYDDRFRGPLSVRSALAGSVNVPAVRTLLLLGADGVVEALRRVGFGGLRRSGAYYGPSLALGSADVTLWELVNAYRTLAQGGVWSPLRLVPDDAGTGAARVAFTPPTAFVVGQMLADREGRSATFGLENALATRFWSAVKTGTSKDMRDNWCVGFGARYTVGVWVGNFAGEPMHDVGGVAGAAPVWRELMTALHEKNPAPPPLPPPGVARATVAFPAGIEPPREEWFLAGTEPRTPARLADASPRIVAPAPGTVIALDPDIPRARQRVALEAPPDTSGAVWTLDGATLGPARGLTLWAPRPGRHTLALRAGDGHELDRVAFEVRGALR